MSIWTYKNGNARSPAAREVRMLTEPCKQFLRTCTGDELMREIRAMLSDQPIEIVDAISMLDYLCELRDKPGTLSLNADAAAQAPLLATLSRGYINALVRNLDGKTAGVMLALADAAGIPK